MSPKPNLRLRSVLGFSYVFLPWNYLHLFFLLFSNESACVPCIYRVMNQGVEAHHGGNRRDFFSQIIY